MTGPKKAKRSKSKDETKDPDRLQLNIRLKPGDRERLDLGAQIDRRNLTDFVRLAALDRVDALLAGKKTT